LQDIVASVDADHSAGDSLFSSKYRFPIFLAVSIAMFNQLSGINAILYYLNQIFAQAGFNKVSSDLQAVAIGATNLVFTMIAMTLIDRIGRKKLCSRARSERRCVSREWRTFFCRTATKYSRGLAVCYIAFFAFSRAP